MIRFSEKVKAYFELKKKIQSADRRDSFRILSPRRSSANRQIEVLQLPAEYVIPGNHIEVTVKTEHSQDTGIRAQGHTWIAMLRPVKGGARNAGANSQSRGRKTASQPRQAQAFTHGFQHPSCSREKNRVSSRHNV